MRSRSWSWWGIAVVCWLSGCAVSHPADPFDGGAADEATGLDDFAVPDDFARAPDLTPPMDLAQPADLTGVCGVGALKINEVQIAGATAGDEWVELFNPCANAVLLTGAKLVYRSATNTTAMDSNLLAPLSMAIPAGGYYLIVGTNYAGTATADAMFTNAGLAATGGAVGLRDAADALVDSMGWGTANNPFVETAAVVAPAANQSAARHPDGHDTNNNSTDFTLGTPTPRAAN
jgi:Lamin Tail Domain